MPIEAAMKNLRAKGFDVGPAVVETQRSSHDATGRQPFREGPVVVSVPVFGINLSYDDVIALDTSGQTAEDFQQNHGLPGRTGRA